jgi:signal peptidase I
MRKKLVRVVLATVVVAAAVALFLYYTFFLHLIRVPTGSMANTIIPGDHLVVKKSAFGGVNRGDLIVFSYQNDPATRYIARVIGMPHESIQIRGKVIYINDQPLDEQRVTVKPNDLFDSSILEELSTEGAGPYRVYYVSDTDHDNTTPYATDEPFRIPDNNYFVMGDNRDNAEDSRYRGSVPKDSIFGKATMIYWSSRQYPTGNEEIKWDRVFTKLN